MAKVLPPDRQIRSAVSRVRTTHRFVSALAWFALGLAAACLARADVASLVPEGSSGFGVAHSAWADHAMVVTAHPLATQAALDILQRGGSAADAAITAQLVLGLVEPQSSGIGGGAFLLHWSQADKKLAAYDGRETAPQQVGVGHFLLQDGQPIPFMDAVIGGKGVGTPGVVALLALTHKQHGRLPWRDLFGPAIRLATDGFAISPRLNQSLQWISTTSNGIGAGEFRAMYFDAGGAPLPAGHRLKNPAYASTLQTIAAGGEAAFYRGALAQQMAQTVRSAGRPGTLAATDLAQYHAIVRPPLCRPYRRFNICGAPPPSSGAFTVLSLLGQLEQLAPTGDANQSAHRFVEASRLAFADRNTYLADPDFVPQPLDTLLASGYLKQRAALIPARRASSGPALPGSIGLHWRPSRSPELPSTTHLSVSDTKGNVVSMTSSIEMAFGSQLMTSGFLLNNQLTDFSFVPRDAAGRAIANRIEPGKRPRSSMAPLIVFEQGLPVLAIGSPGGSRIIDYVARVLVQHLDAGMPLTQAIAAPHVVNMNGDTEVESRADADALATALQEMGHQVKRLEQTSGLHAIAWQRTGKSGAGRLLGVADPRREGQAAGY